ncbi:hypothetical protein L218DRAFT_4584 [Marasmius fiardii PR-910]|nr:hypothetical protein L218DRAFT_4584 [Marasmius fiardii PR-910]
MPPVASTLRQLAMLGGPPAFPPSEPVPLINVRGYRPRGDFTAVDAMLANEANKQSKTRASNQRFVAKILPGVENPGASYRVTLQRRLGEFMSLDPDEISVICVTSGTNALRVVLKGVRAVAKSNEHDEVIVPKTTVGATIEAVIDEGFKPVFVDVDPASWLLSPEDTERAITDKTAAIITVDWLGTQCDLGPFRKLADKHGIKLISDSAQSFGASSGQPPSVNLAHATIFSLGYPKVFTGAGSGGLIVCSKDLLDLLKNDSTGILRREVLAEPNAFMCLESLLSLPKDLENRRNAGELYRQLLARCPGITFQKVPAGLSTNHYQISFTVDTDYFGLNAKDLCRALKAENVHCSADRMPCVGGMEKFTSRGRVEGDVEHSRLLAMTSVTVPISNIISLDTVEMICRMIAQIHKNAPEILDAKQKGQLAQTTPTESADIIDLESKYRQHLIIPVLDDASRYSDVFIPRDYMLEQKISIDEFLKRFNSQPEWNLNERVLAELRVDAIIGKTVILSPHSAGHKSGNPVALDESGSSADVTLVPGADGKLTVRKSASGYGIDGNGAPWLRRQNLFLDASRAVKKTGMFVKPLKVVDNDSDVTLELPYIPSYSIGELILANAGPRRVVEVLVYMLARMATSVWTEGQEEADTSFIQKAHFDRMRRRLKIASAQDETLHKILQQKTVILNDRQLLGFDTVMEKLENHPVLKNIAPTILSEIHGDLNIHNILARLDPDDKEPVALIDPRGVPLLSDSEAEAKDDDDKVFERGDYCYDVSKLLFSLTGFLEIRKQLFDFSANDDSYTLTIQQHPGYDTMNGAAHMLIPALASNKVMRQWIDKVEHHGAYSFEMRVRVGEAAHFVSDCACALGRDTPQEVVPLFLMGLLKLNDVVALLDGTSELSVDDDNDAMIYEFTSMEESADLGAMMIQEALFKSQTSNQDRPYDVLEISVKNESASTLQKLLRKMVGTYLPKGAAVYLSTDPIDSDVHFPCVIIHPSNGVRGQTHMLASCTRRTNGFFTNNGVLPTIINNLRIIHISSTGSSSRSQFTGRDNDKLLSPGSFGISPLHLTVMQANQLSFPKPGRWVVENDSFFLLSRPLNISGDELCLLAMKRPTSGSSSSWRVCIDKYEEKDGRLFAKHFRDIEPHEQEEPLLRTTTGLFLPHHLVKEIALKEDDYAQRTSPLLIDIVLPRFMEHNDWIQLSHSQGYGTGSHQVWENAEYFKAVSQHVELANGGEEMAFYYYGSDKEYLKLLAKVREDPLLNSLAYAGATAQWRTRHDETHPESLAE